MEPGALGWRKSATKIFGPIATVADPPVRTIPSGPPALMTEVMVSLPGIPRPGSPDLASEILGLPGFIVHAQSTPRDDVRAMPIRVKGKVPSAAPTCPCCHQTMGPNGWLPTTLLDVPQGSRFREIEVQRQHWRCAMNHTLLLPVEFADPDHRITRRLADWIITICGRESSFSGAAAMTGVSERVIRSVYERWLIQAEEAMPRVAPRFLGIDEAHLSERPIGVLTDLDPRDSRTKPREGKGVVLDILPQRSQEWIEAALRRLHDLDRLEVAAIDMHWPYYRALLNVKGNNFTVVIDKRHVLECVRRALVTLADEVMDELKPHFRGDEFKSLKRRLIIAVTTRCYLLRDQDCDVLERIAKMKPIIRLAYIAKEGFFNIYNIGNAEDAERAIQSWQDTLPSDLAQKFSNVLKTLRDWRRPILNYWRSPSRITNAGTESANNLIKLMSRNARGFGRVPDLCSPEQWFKRLDEGESHPFRIFRGLALHRYGVWRGRQ